MCTSLDGRIATADGRPVQLAFPGWDAGALGFYELQARCDAVLMGRTTFEPAMSAPFWPWDLAVYVLGSRLPPGAPENVVVEADPGRLLGRLREEDRGGDVHLVGGPRTIEAFRDLGALDELRLMVLPMFLGEGRQLTPDVAADIGLSLVETRNWPNGVVELAYAVEPHGSRGGS